MLLEAAVRRNDNSAELYNSLGNTLSEMGRPEDAVQQYRRGVKLCDSVP